jgi:class 3 adenylate cyclase/tetratricopeptide (TPR) repeat protein
MIQPLTADDRLSTLPSNASHAASLHEKAMHCPACRLEVAVGARFCAACGTRLAPTCAACGAELPAAARFCPACGGAVASGAAGARTPDTYTPPHLAQRILTSRAALQGERKPVTVLFCDLVGSTAIAERLGPDAMHDLLNRFFETALAEVHRYEGTVNQFLGDGFMALFGAPLAHEDHARRAALAALGLAQALAAPLVLDSGIAVTLTVRMGLNTGLVVVGAIGDNLRMDYTAVGDCTHLAARLQQSAAPGTIVVSQATARQLDAHLALEPLGALDLRGLSEAVTVFRLTGARADPAGERVSLRARTAFVGREREAVTLQSLVADLARGQGRVAGIVGEPGVGKSRLLSELRQAVGESVAWYEGRCLSYGATIPYLPVLDLLRGVCSITDAETPEHAAERVRTTLQALGLDAAPRAPALLQLLGLKPADAETAALDGDALLGRTLDTLRQLWLRSSARRPLVLVVEDLHWIDPASERCLAGLAESLGGAAVLLLATYRPGYRPAWIDRSYATQISLAPLGRDESLRVVRSLAGPIADDATLTRLILDKAEGNPFFLEELVHAVGDEPGRSFAVPDSVQGVLAARIDRLPESAKLLLQTAAVLGREFTESLLGAIADTPDRVGADLRELTRLEFLHERADADERAYVFKHALTQDVAYATLVAPRRRALHRRAAEALMALDVDRRDDLAPMLAHHYLEAEAWAEAAVHAERAARIASRAWANREALARYDQALLAAERASRPAAERRALLEARAAVCTVLGRFDPAREDLEAALALAEGDAAAQGRVLSALGELWGGHRDYARGLDLTRQAVSILDTAGDRPALAGARAQLGIMLLNIVRMSESRDELETAHALYESLADGRGQARVLEILGMNLMLSGDLQRAAGLLERVIPTLRALGDRRAEAGALCSQGAVLIMQQGLDIGLQSLQHALEVSRSMEARGDEAFAHALSSEMRAWFGALDAAAAEAARALAIARELGHLEWTAYALGILGRVHAECGDVAGARALHDEEAALTRRLGGHIWIADAIGNIGQDLVCAGDLHEGRRHLMEAIAIAGECREKAMFPLLQLAACELRAERPDEALAVVARFRAECGGYRALLVEARRLEAEAWRIRGRTADAEAALRAVMAESEAFQYDASRWRAGLTLAELLRARGETDEARRHAAAVQAALDRVARGLPHEPLGRAFRQSALFRDAVRLAGSAVTT